MNDRSVSIRCPVCNAFLAKVSLYVDTADPTLKSHLEVETVCPNRRCKRKDRRVVEAFLPKIGGVVNRK